MERTIKFNVPFHSWFNVPLSLEKVKTIKLGEALEKIGSSEVLDCAASGHY